MAWNMLQCIDSSDEFKLINSYLFVRLNPSLDPKRDRIVRSSDRNRKIILYIIIIPLFCIVINRFWLLIKFINSLLPPSPPPGHVFEIFPPNSTYYDSLGTRSARNTETLQSPFPYGCKIAVRCGLKRASIV